MKINFPLLLCLACGVIACRHTAEPAVQQADVLRRIAFGSCAKQDKPQPIWHTIAGQKPDVFLFIGDAVYADTTDPSEAESSYAKLAAKPGFQLLRETCPLYAVWDDHDYGLDDGGAEHPRKDQMQQFFLRFFREPEQSPRWQRQGMFGSWTIGPPGKRVQLILLDTRYHRSPLNALPLIEPSIYLPNSDPSATILGAQQWRWLESELREPADLRLLVSSIQIIPDDHPFEKWANFPLERERLLALLAQPHVNGLILLSGDQHMGEISVLQRQAAYDLVEITASGLTHTRGLIPAPNRHRSGDVVLDLHFGTVDIAWEADDPVVELRIVNQDGVAKIERRIPLRALRAPSG